ncbi:IS5 family transposase [Amycolatopsis thermoflava]|uniref:IS5 family transposase n=1 Tax=Amycolatopsis thermoflava TaxID=84480 RepID=UPI003EB6FDC6
MPRSPAPASTPPPSPATQGAGSNYTKPGIEPPDHAIGRSRGGPTTKIHRLADGHGRPLVTLLIAGQAGDSPMFEPLMAHLQVPRLGGGRPRTRPDLVRGDKAYSSRAIRQHLRRRGIRTIIPEPADQIAHRKRRGSRGGRPPTFHALDYRGRNVIERSFNQLKQWRSIATRYDKLATLYRAAILIHDIITWTKALSDAP